MLIDAQPLGDVHVQEGSLVTPTQIALGSFLQAESLSPQLAGDNVLSGLKALAREGREKQAAKALTSSSTAPTPTTGPDQQGTLCIHGGGGDLRH